MNRFALPSLLAVSTILACSGGDAPSGVPAATVRDSAGVTITENPAAAAAHVLPWTVGTAPTLDIGTVDGADEYQLYRVQSALRLPDGRILVANAGSGEVRSYDSSGTYLASWGGQGEGPGEFMHTTRMKLWPAGDSIGVWDQRLGRLTILGTGEGRFGRTLRIPELLGVGSPTFFDILPDRRMIVMGTQFAEFVSGQTRVPTTYAVVDAEGALLTGLGTYPGPETVLQISESAVQILSVPLGRDNRAARVGGEMIIASNEGFELPFYALDGVMTRLVRVDVAPRALDETLRAAEIDRRVGNLPEEAQPGYRANLEDMEFPPTVPVFDAILVDHEGNIWVSLYQPPTEPGPVTWVVLDPEGQVLGSVETPEGLDVSQIGEDFILGSMEDELEVEHVQLWPLRR